MMGFIERWRSFPSFTAHWHFKIHQALALSFGFHRAAAFFNSPIVGAWKPRWGFQGFDRYIVVLGRSHHVSVPPVFEI